MSLYCRNFSVPCCLHVNKELADCESYSKGSLRLFAVERIPVELSVLRDLHV